MPFAYLILLIAGPLLELALLIKVGQWIGIWLLFGLIIGSGILGFFVLRSTGMSVLRNMMSGTMAAQPMPTMFDTSVRFTAGVLLILPGLIGDVIGLLLLIPAVRGWIVPRIWGAMTGGGAKWSRATWSRSTGWQRSRPGPADAHASPDGRPATEPGTRAGAAPVPPRSDAGPVIDGEFERIGERPLGPKGKRTGV